MPSTYLFIFRFHEYKLEDLVIQVRRRSIYLSVCLSTYLSIWTFCLHMHMLPTEASRVHLPLPSRNWSNWWLWIAMWVLETEPARAATALNCWVIAPAPSSTLISIKKFPRLLLVFILCVHYENFSFSEVFYWNFIRNWFMKVQHATP